MTTGIMAKRILLVDDKANVRQMTREVLIAEGFDVLEASNGQEALFVARAQKPDVILLDVMMPEMGGYEFLRIYRKEKDTPIMMLTAKLEESDKVLGLELGADDYMTKPFGMKELVARVHALLRRAHGQIQPPAVLSHGGIRVELDSRDVSIAGKPVLLTPSEYELLTMLMSAPGRVFSRSEIRQRMQGSTYEGLERGIDVHVRNLRAKIETTPSSPEYIETVFGVGYRLRPKTAPNRQA